MAQFLDKLGSDLIGYKDTRAVHKLTRPLIWVHDGKCITVPEGFETDFASVPRLPIIYGIWGDRAHREAVLHDYLYRVGSVIIETNGLSNKTIENIPKEDADWIFREAMIGQGRSWVIYHPMYLAVRLRGGSSFHRMCVMDSFALDEIA